MFTDPLTLIPDASSVDSNAVSVPRVSSSPKGVFRQILAVGEFLEVSISHSESKENKGILTDRHLIRFDHVKPDTVGSTIRASAYMVFTVPRGTITQQQAIDNVLRLLSFLLDFNGGELNWDSTGVSLVTAQARVESQISRLMSGES